jgi:hypothetical protein
VSAALLAGDAADAVVAAALATSDYASHSEAAARLLLAVSLDDLRQAEVGAREGESLDQLRLAVGGLVLRLSEQVWGRTDGPAARLIKYCVVDLPSALLLAQGRLADPIARHALEQAVRGIVAHPPPSR